MSVRVGARVAPSTGVRKLRRPVATAAAPSFNPLTGWTTDPIHGVWASDPLWTPPADGGAVSSWRNGGSVGGDLVQATGSKQPTYRASTAAFNNQPTVQGDGTDDFLKATWASIPQPWWIVAVGSTGGTAAATRTLCDGVAAGNRAAVSKAAGTETWAISAGIAVVGGTADQNAHLIVFRADGASSTLAVDGTGVLASHAGAHANTGLTLLMNQDTTSNPGSGHVAYWALFDTDPTALPEWATFKAWVTSTYGVTVA